MTATATNPNIQMPPAVDAHLVLDGLTIYYGTREAVARTDLAIPRKQVTAIIGPSGCGKSTLLRSLNRMHETVPGGRAEGRVLLDGANIYDPGVDPIQVRRRIGMVFQQPNPLRARTIAQNVSIGLELDGIGRREKEAAVERALKRAALWDEVSDRLDRPGTALSGGQQQRLCLARALAVEPELILMDEPASALDPIATLRIEELIRELMTEITIVIVTHNMQQAARVSDYTIFMNLNKRGSGGVVEAGPTQTIFTAPKSKQTEDYITGRFG
ncbi:MAG TPA: phosphate ABC transporter ATP-binding protein PstB [Nitrolancea sp.]|jgi:phosphate transport system ATP-binding protein|nr:phosphate ABC transporter ATP-binding protein PstB [Nitrolancea sp.]